MTKQQRIALHLLENDDQFWNDWHDYIEQTAANFCNEELLEECCAEYALQYHNYKVS